MNIDIGFLIKNILSSLLMPLSFGIFIGTVALWYLYRNRLFKAKIFLLLALIWISVISYRPTSYFLLDGLEKQYPKLENIPEDVHYLLLLGGDKEKRTWEALRLYYKKPHLEIITSGYKNQAQENKKLLIASGIPKERILMQTEPKDTQEEALAIKKRLGKEKFILITSAYHMPRSMGIFQKEGLNPIPAPTDFQRPNSFWAIPRGYYLTKTEQAWHEYLGLLWIYLKN